MKILLLAPQPFFQERGTPIAVRLAAEVLASRQQDSVTILTYPEGNDIDIPNVEVKRVTSWPKIYGISPGFSLKKLYLDLFFLIALVRELWSCRSNQYDIIHAVEESVFMAWILRPFFRIPFIYDMDSSLSLQLIEKLPLLRPLLPLFRWIERQAIQQSLAVVPVCDALEVIAISEGAKHTQILRDISLLDLNAAPSCMLRQEAEIEESKQIILYVGNLESYQGIDL
ncbi:MAG: hypothetical protein KDD60_00260 [Bdellovibrionales bacterium]|nr:hypothetical protein [Bdellovibrionales bacterium]